MSGVPDLHLSQVRVRPVGGSAVFPAGKALASLSDLFSRTVDGASGFPDPEVTGVVLAGGAARRMGRDKTALRLPGGKEDLLGRAVALLRRVTTDVRVSCRPGQEDRAARAAGASVVTDRHPEGGALRAVCSVLRQVGRPCLIMACDMPFLSAEALAVLLQRRRLRPPETLMTAWKGKESGLVEPLAAVYEPECLPLFEAAVAAGRFRLGCVVPEDRRLCLEYEQADAGLFWNVNEPDDWREALRRARSPECRPSRGRRPE